MSQTTTRSPERKSSKKRETPVATRQTDSFVVNPPSVGGDVLHRKGDQRAGDKKTRFPWSRQGRNQTSSLFRLTPPRWISTREVICRIWSSAFFHAPLPAFCSIIFSTPRVASNLDRRRAMRRAIFNIYVAIAVETRSEACDDHEYIALIREHYSATRATYIVQYVLEREENLLIYSGRSDKDYSHILRSLPLGYENKKGRIMIIVKMYLYTK